MAKNTIKTLLVDDCEEIHDLLSEYLSNAEHDLEFVIDYSEKFEQTKIDFSYDIYVIDDMFGAQSRSVEMASAIRQEDADAKIFVISGQASQETLRQLINLRVDGFIEKDVFDITPIVKAGESVALFRDQVERLNSKISKLLSIDGNPNK